MPTPTLAITDAANGGGFTAAVANSAGGTNTLYRAAFNGKVGTQAWVNSGSRIGDGNIAGTAGSAGYYWWRLESLQGANLFHSDLYYQNLRSALSSIDYDILIAAAAVVNGLALPGIAEVAAKRMPDDGAELGNVVFPCVQLHSWDGAETEVGGTNRQDDIGYPVHFWLLTEDEVSLADDMRCRYWRHRILAAFRNQKLAGVPRVQRALVEPGPVITLAVNTNRDRYFQASLGTIRFITRELRGLSV